MKILLYTICDFKPYAINCIELLLKSITFDIEYDFLIVSNKINNDTNYRVITESSIQSEYIGYVKYSPLIPNNYDYYVYLDADILYFDKISKLLSTNANFTIVKENCNIDKNDWYYFKYVDVQESQVLQNSHAVNAGSFCYTQNQIEHINQIYKLYVKHCKNNINHDVRLEQSIYNYIVNKVNNYDLKDCYDITDKVQLYAGTKPMCKNKTLHHFCGFTNEMYTKYITMKNFYDQYTTSK
jgi:hypothetical protein